MGTSEEEEQSMGLPLGSRSAYVQAILDMLAVAKGGLSAAETAVRVMDKAVRFSPFSDEIWEDLVLTSVHIGLALYNPQRCWSLRDNRQMRTMAWVLRGLEGMLPRARLLHSACHPSEARVLFEPRKLYGDVEFGGPQTWEWSRIANRKLAYYYFDPELGEDERKQWISDGSCAVVYWWKGMAAKEYRDWGEDLSFFLRELAALTELPPHPNVVSLKHLLLRDTWDPPVLLFPFVSGMPLWALAAPDRPRVPNGLMCETGAQLFDGLAHLHAHGILHKDLHPSNVLVDVRAWTVKICDLSHSRFATVGQTSIEHDPMSPGGHYFKAPESLLRPAFFSRASDVWQAALNVLMLVLHREPVLARGTREQHLQFICCTLCEFPDTTPPPRPFGEVAKLLEQCRFERFQCPEGGSHELFESLFEHALVFDPEERRSAAEVAKVLRGV